jgi:hypothetical protein
MTSVATYLDTLVRETHRTEAEVVAQAFETGLRQLWREYTLGRFLRLGMIPLADAWQSLEDLQDVSSLFVTRAIAEIAIEQLTACSRK